jgi:hypothetical protein
MIGNRYGYKSDHLQRQGMDLLGFRGYDRSQYE